MNQAKHQQTQKVIGLVMDFFNPKLLEGARAYCEEQNIRLDARWSVRGDWLPEKLNWDGVMHGLVDQSSVAERLPKTTIPAVVLTADGAPPSVVPNYHACGQLAVQELHSYGVEHLLIARLSPRSLDLDFFHGAVSAARSLELNYTEHQAPNQRFRSMIQRLKKTILDLPKPLGFCLPHAAVGHSITNAINASGLRVPEDVAIVVIDKDVQQTAALAPVSLTSIELNEWHRGFVAAETLHQLILKKTLLNPSLQIPPRGIRGRASTGHVETRDPMMAKALGYIRAHFKEGIGVPEIVQAAGASRRVVEMRFRDILNRSIHEELRRLRIEFAQQHLKEQKMTVTDIAHCSGFSSVHYFSAAFKREMGISPRQFQKKCQAD